MGYDDGEQQRSAERYQQAPDPNALSSSLPPVPPALAYFGLGKPSALSGLRVEELMAMLDHQDWSMRVSAIRQLEHLSAQMVIEPLISALNDEHKAVRAAAARALGNLGAEVPLAPLVAALQDPEWLVRAAAVGALGKQHTHAPIEPLLTALKDDDESVRLAATKAVGSLGERTALGPLTAALHDSAWSVREAAVHALGEAGTRIPIEPLLIAHHDADAAVREAAKLVLQQVHPEFSTFFDEMLSSSQLAEKSAIQTGELVWPVDPASAPNELAPAELWHVDTRRKEDEQIPVKASSGVSDHEQLPLGTPSSHQPTLSRLSRRKGRTSSMAKRASSTRLALLPLFGRALAAVLVLGIGLAWLALSHTTQTTTGTFFRYPSHKGGISKVAWSAPSASGSTEQVAFAEADGMVQVYDIASGQFIKDYGPYHVLAMTWGASGLRVASLEGSGVIQLYQLGNTTSPALMHPISLPLPPDSLPLVVWSTDGTHVAFAVDRTISVWDTTNQHMTTHVGLATVTALAWSQDGAAIASAYDDGKNRNIEIWDAITGKVTTPLEEPYQSVGFRVVTMAWSPAGADARLAYTLSDGDVQVWDRTLGTTFSLNRTDPNRAPDKNPPGQGFPSALAWSPDGQRLASTTATGVIQVWDEAHGNQLYTYTRHTQPINALAWSYDGKRIVSVSIDGLLLVWGQV